MGTKRSTALPDVPASAEQGYPNYTVPAWAGIWTAAGVPQPVVDRLMASLRTVMSRKDVQDRIVLAGIMPEVKDGAALRKLISDELENVRTMMRNAKVEPQ